MAKKKRRVLSPEFKAKAAGLCSAGQRPIGEVAKDLGIGETALRRWVSQAEADAGQGPSSAVTTAEKDELVRLRRDNKRLRQEREILKAAATFFAKENE